MIEIIEISNDKYEEYNSKLLDFENFFKYSLGTDYFSIDHGSNYYQFFKNIGRSHFFIAQDRGQIIGVCVIILREIKISDNEMLEPIWYLCDLKIHPKYQGKFYYYYFLKYIYEKYSNVSRKVYAISMNSNQNTNKLVNLAGRLELLKLSYRETLEFYLIDSTQQNLITKLLELHNGGGFISLSGIKDLVLTSTKEPLEFLHYTRKEIHKLIKTSLNEKYMFCCPRNSSKSNTFNKINIPPIATASIIANFRPNNWDFIESGEI